MTEASKPYNRRRRSTRGLLIAVAGLELAACVRTPPPAVIAPPPAPPPPRLQRYTGAGFFIDTPLGWAVKTDYDYEDVAPGKEIHGVSFTIPAQVAAGTNLAPDSYIAVETLPGLRTCAAAPFLSDPDALPPVTEDGFVFSVAKASQGAAGNVYEETVFAAAGTRPCIAVRYFIHSLNIGNFDPGAVKPFDRAALVAQFDSIRKSLRLAPAQPRGRLR